MGRIELTESPGKVLAGSGIPAMKYLGFALLLAWHYCLWFVPNVFVGTALLAEAVTYSWLIDLGASVLCLFLIPLLLGRRRYLSSHHWLYWAVPITASVGTLALTLFAFSLDTPLLAYILAAIVGGASAFFWILWGEFFARIKANFSINHIGPVVGVTTVVLFTITIVLPQPLASVFVSLLPLAAGFIFAMANKANEQAPFPPLLPKSTTRKGVKTIIIVCIISFTASMACYFLVAIIPWEALPAADSSFTYGSMGGAFLMLIIGLICIVSKSKINIFGLFPWLLVFIVVAFALFLADEALYFPSFIIALAVSSVFEVLLAMYFGILTSKGYAAPALAFGFSGGFIRAGIAFGNTWAIGYEHAPDLAAAITPETALMFMCVLVAILIPLVRQGYNIAKLTTDPPSETDLEKRCAEVAGEFGLSARETEILVLIARGFTADNIAKKLVISPYTVNTHIRHTYEKMAIHKRSELINYITMQNTEN
ncbi:MAG: helix-turn-helix transcriptional regulator [Raoultibacter sp.]